MVAPNKKVVGQPSPLRQEIKASDLDREPSSTRTSDKPALLRKESVTSLRSATDSTNNVDPDVVERTDTANELEVTFFPPLFLQRRMWILSTLRSLNITKVLDVGCGEGQLLSVLCQPSVWLLPPPPPVLVKLSAEHRTSTSSLLSSHDTVIQDPTTPVPTSPAYNDESTPNLHISHIWGLDIDDNDLAFAVNSTAPPAVDPPEQDKYRRYGELRWEQLEAHIWKGGLEVVNEAFVGVECIVCTEVIEHLQPDSLRAVGPMLLGIYHPRYLLITTPSYDFNARFAPPNDPTARHGYKDPSKRTDRIFRHEDHKFEWTRAEFKEWCKQEAETWGYDVEVGTLGRPVEADPWGRDNELDGASSWALFKCGSIAGREQEMEKKAREALSDIRVEGRSHELLVSHVHPPHLAAQHPQPLAEIGERVKKVMDDCRETFMPVENLWFTPEVAVACGGWIEVLVKAVEETEGVILKKDEGGADTGLTREKWAVEMVGGTGKPRMLWPQSQGGFGDLDVMVDQVPSDWTPGEEGDSDFDDNEWGESTGMDGDVSLTGSEVDDDEEEDIGVATRAWKAENWNKKPVELEVVGGWGTAEWGSKWSAYQREERLYSSATSTAGWDGDASDDTT